MIFADRKDAGRQLAVALQEFKDNPDVLVLALPRGGVPVAAEVAKELNAPLEVYLIRKLGFPGQIELAMGAIDILGEVALNSEIIINVSSEAVAHEIDVQKKKLEARRKLYKCKIPIVKNKTVIVIDDGLATGASMRVAISSLKKLGAKSIIVAVPVAPRNAFEALRPTVNNMFALDLPEYFGGVGARYDDFSQVTDEEVIRILKEFSPKFESSGARVELQPR
jgi:predicted phosphoribosyltransferase